MGAARVVSRVSYYSWDAARGWVELENLQTIIEQFGPEGRILSRELRYGEKLLEATAYRYSPEGAVKLTVDAGNDPEESRGDERRRVDDRERLWRCGGSPLLNVLRTDPAGRRIEVERRDAKEAFLYRIRYLYDARGDPVEPPS